MRAIRKGIDIRVIWSILTNGEAVSLDGRDISVELTDRFCHVKDLDFTYSGNTLSINYYGIEQESYGVHMLTVWENRGKIGQNAIDRCAFRLVTTTEQMGGTDDKDNLETQVVELENGNFITLFGGGNNAAPPYDDTAVWNAINKLEVNKADKKYVDSILITIREMQTRMLDMQKQIDSLISGGVVPTPPQTVTNALMLHNGKFIMLHNGTRLILHK